MQDITKVKDIMLQMYEEKDKNNQFIINQFELQTQQYEKLTNDLTKEVKSKRRNAVFWKIATGLGIFSSTYLLLR